MPERANGRSAARSALAMAVLKGGLALGIVWVLGLLAFAAHLILEYV